MTSSSSRPAHSPWLFYPLLSLAVIAATLFGIVTLGLLGRFFQYRAWFMTALIVGALMETLGLGARAACVEQLQNAALYKMQLVCTILPPVFTAAAEYVILGRIMEYVGRRYSLLRPSLVSWIFISSDIISFLIQVGGAILLLAQATLSPSATPDQIQHAQNQQNLGDKIILVGLGVNLASFIIFVVQITWFDYRTRKHAAPGGRWRTLLYALYASSLGVLIRQTFRIIEFAQGGDSYIAIHEGYFYGLDSLPILIASAIYIWFWPSRYIPNDKQATLAREVDVDNEVVEMVPPNTERDTLNRSEKIV